jgi:hypothetical protein
MDLQQASSNPAIFFSPPNRTTLSFFSNRAARSERQEFLFCSPVKSFSQHPYAFLDRASHQARLHPAPASL